MTDPSNFMNLAAAMTRTPQQQARIDELRQQAEDIKAGRPLKRGVRPPTAPPPQPAAKEPEPPPPNNIDPLKLVMSAEEHRSLTPEQWRIREMAKTNGLLRLPDHECIDPAAEARRARYAQAAQPAKPTRQTERSTKNSGRRAQRASGESEQNTGKRWWRKYKGFVHNHMARLKPGEALAWFALFSLSDSGRVCAGHGQLSKLMGCSEWESKQRVKGLIKAGVLAIESRGGRKQGPTIYRLLSTVADANVDDSATTCANANVDTATTLEPANVDDSAKVSNTQRCGDAAATPGSRLATANPARLATANPSHERTGATIAPRGATSLHGQKNHGHEIEDARTCADDDAQQPGARTPGAGDVGQPVQLGEGGEADRGTDQGGDSR